MKQNELKPVRNQKTHNRTKTYTREKIRKRCISRTTYKEMVHSTVKNEHQENYRQWTKDTSDINVPLKTMGKTS